MLESVPFCVIQKYECHHRHTNLIIIIRLKITIEIECILQLLNKTVVVCFSTTQTCLVEKNERTIKITHHELGVKGTLAGMRGPERTARLRKGNALW